MRGCFQALDASLKVGECLLQFANAAIELGVREFDHRLRVGKASLDCFVQPFHFTIHLLFKLSDSLRQRADHWLGHFEGCILHS